MGSGEQRRYEAPPRRQATVLESVEEIRAQVRSTIAARDSAPANALPGEATQQTQPFRPVSRPAMALLCVLDDGDDSGETLRVRQNSFVIGRVEGNLVIPHDGGVSTRHAELIRRIENGESAWYLKDLQSTNGTFVRASNVVLYDDQEILICSHRFRMEITAPDAKVVEPPNATRKWESLGNENSAKSARATLVEISPGNPVQRHELLGGREYWVGRDPQQCSIVIDDPMIDRRHARIFRDAKNRWAIANNRSVNGVWARIQDVALGRGAYFQCGEQRFFFKVV